MSFQPLCKGPIKISILCKKYICLFLAGSDIDLDAVTSEIEAIKLDVDLKRSEFDRILNLAQDLSKTGHQTTLVRSANEYFIKYQVSGALISFIILST